MPTSPETLGVLLTQLRDEVLALKAEVAATRTEVLESQRQIMDMLAAFEARLMARLDKLSAKV